jgi:hypothetical protein
MTLAKGVDLIDDATRNTDALFEPFDFSRLIVPVKVGSTSGIVVLWTPSPCAGTEVYQRCRAAVQTERCSFAAKLR